MLMDTSQMPTPDADTYPPRLAEVLPGLPGDILGGLRDADRMDLADQVADLRIRSRCRCGDAFCGSFYTATKRGPAPGLETVPLSSDIILDVIDGAIVFVEVLNRPDVREGLDGAGFSGTREPLP